MISYGDSALNVLKGGLCILLATPYEKISAGMRCRGQSW